MSKEHIWSDWLEDILPKYDSRWEGYTENPSALPSAYVSTKQGDVMTKKVRVVCAECNNGWMSKIVEKAKPFAKALILGEPVELNPSAQQALTNWIALSALMANQITQSEHKLPTSDIGFFYKNRCTPPHWFVGIGRLEAAFRGVCFNHAPFSLQEPDTRTGLLTLSFVKHAFASTIGSLYTLVDVETDLMGRFPLPFGGVAPARVYEPEIVSIQPVFSPTLRTPFLLAIDGGPAPGHFYPGTQAFEVARRGSTVISNALRIARIVPPRSMP